VGLSGVEPLTSRLSGVRSNQLSYRPSYEAVSIAYHVLDFKKRETPKNPPKTP
jgi:hypothetical protein